MEFSDVIKYRTSIRKYCDREVEDEKIIYILECARLAPSAMNKQSWRFVVIKNKETIAQIAKTSLINRWLKTAPVLIIACADPTLTASHNNIPFYVIDVSIALEHLVLAATDIGLGTCWIGRFNEDEIKKLLEIPKRIRVVSLTPIGYPAGTKGIVETLTTTLIKSKKRKSLDEIVHHEHW